MTNISTPGVPLLATLRTPDHNDFAFGAFTGGTLIGICGFVREKRRKAQHRGEIIQMFVDPAFARKGIGRTLLTLAMDKAFENTHIEQIVLGVVHTNDNAVRLYKQLGFVEYGRLEHSFKRGDGYSTQLFLAVTREGRRSG